MKPAVVLDLDGTLVDTALDIGAALSGVLEEDGFAPASEAEVRSWVGDGGAVLLRRAFRARGRGLGAEEVGPRLARFRDLYAARPLQRSVPYPGMVEAVQALRAAGYPLAVCTNKPRLHTDLVLDGLDLRRWFDAVVAGDDLPVRKPHPEHLWAAVRGAGAVTGVLVGDGPADLGAAKAAELQFVAVTWGYGPASLQEEAAAVCPSAGALLEIVGRLGVP